MFAAVRLLTYSALPLVFLASIAASQSSVSIPDAHIVDGRVLAAEDFDRPVREATVVLTSIGGVRSPMIAITDTDGGFRFQDVSAGQYSLVVRKPGFIDAAFGETDFLGAGSPISVGRTSSRHLVLRLSRGGVIAGTIQSELGEPAANIVVTAALAPPRLPSQTWTNIRGEYRFYGLAPGAYVISAQPPHGMQSYPRGTTAPGTAENDRRLLELARGSPSQPGQQMVRTTPTTNRASILPGLAGYPPVYFPGTLDPGSAVEVTIGPGEARINTDFGLILGGLSRVRGVVVGVGSARASVRAVSRVRRGTLQARMNGATFELVNVPPGRYTLIANVERSIAAAGNLLSRRPLLEWGMEDVTVAAGDIDGVELRLRPAMKIVGRVVLDGLSSSQIGQEHGVRVTASPDNASALRSTVASAMSSNGSFVLDSLGPGTYSLGVSSETRTDLWVRSAIFQGSDLLDQPLILGPGRLGLNGVTLLVTSQAIGVEGIFRDRDGAPAHGYHIIAFAADSRFWIPGSRRIQTTRPASDGRYAFRRLPPGSYYLAAVTRLESDLLNQADFLREALNQAVPVTIRDASMTTLDIQLGR